MKVNCRLLECMHLDPGYALLSVQNCITCLELFRMLDIHNNNSLNDAQFDQFLLSFTDLTRKQVSTLFELLDIDQSGEMEFDEFYLVLCILVSCKDQYEKEFIYRHSRSIFRLIDADNSGLISSNEFSQMGVLFNFDYNSILSIFNEFDVSGDKNLDFGEFRLFTMACIDEQRSADANLKVKSLTDYHMRLLYALTGIVTTYIRRGRVPRPRSTEAILDAVPPPEVPEVKRRFSFWDWRFIKSKLAVIWLSIVTLFCGASCMVEGTRCFRCCKKCRFCCRRNWYCSCTDPSYARFGRYKPKSKAEIAERRNESFSYYHKNREKCPPQIREYVPVVGYPEPEDKRELKVGERVARTYHRLGRYVDSKGSVGVPSLIVKPKHPGQGYRKLALRGDPKTRRSTVTLASPKRKSSRRGSAAGW